jgi:hypothetical protein
MHNSNMNMLSLSSRLSRVRLEIGYTIFHYNVREIEARATYKLAILITLIPIT